MIPEEVRLGRWRPYEMERGPSIIVTRLQINGDWFDNSVESIPRHPTCWLRYRRLRRWSPRNVHFFFDH